MWSRKTGWENSEGSKREKVRVGRNEESKEVIED